MLVTIWHILTNDTDYADLGADWFDRRSDNEQHARRLVHQIERLGYKITVEAVAAGYRAHLRGSRPAPRLARPRPRTTQVILTSEPSVEISRSPLRPARHLHRRRQPIASQQHCGRRPPLDGAQPPTRDRRLSAVRAYNDAACIYNMLMSASEHLMTVSQNGQVSIPAATRARWRARHVIVVDLGDRVVIRPASDEPFAELEGKYKGRGPTSDQARRQARQADPSRKR